MHVVNALVKWKKSVQNVYIPFNSILKNIVVLAYVEVRSSQSALLKQRLRMAPIPPHNFIKISSDHMVSSQCWY